MRLKDKVAVITGGSSGIGHAITLGYVKEGAKVVIAALHEEPCLETVKEVEDMGGRAIYYTLDVSDLSKHRELLDTAVNKFGKVDVLVNDAGNARREDVFDVTHENWEKMMDINLKSFFFCPRASQNRSSRRERPEG